MYVYHILLVEEMYPNDLNNKPNYGPGFFSGSPHFEIFPVWCNPPNKTRFTYKRVKVFRTCKARFTMLYTCNAQPTW